MLINNSVLIVGTVMHHGHQFLCALRPPDDHVDSNSHISYFAHLLTSVSTSYGENFMLVSCLKKKEKSARN